MVSWLVTRHVLFLFVIRSTIFDGPMLITFIWDPSNGRVVTKEMFYGFAGLLLALQVNSGDIDQIFDDDELIHFF